MPWEFGLPIFLSLKFINFIMNNISAAAATSYQSSICDTAYIDTAIIIGVLISLLLFFVFVVGVISIFSKNNA